MITIQRNQSTNDGGGAAGFSNANNGGGSSGGVPPTMPPDVPEDINDPLNAPRVERPYSTSPRDFAGTAPEPPDMPPPDINQPGAEAEGEGAGGEGGGEKSDMPPGEKIRSSKDLAKYAIKAYAEYIPLLFRHIATVPEKKLDDLANKGEVDFSQPLKFADGSIEAAGDYLLGVNANIQHEFGVSEEWKEDVTPVLARYLKEKGWGMTIGEQLLWLFGKDLGAKAWQAMSIKKSIDDTLEFLKEQTKLRNAASSGGGSAPPSGSSPSGTGSPSGGGGIPSGSSSRSNGSSASSQQPDSEGVITIPPSEVEELPPTV